ncbi:2-amino-4-hydroxy-6-hydroxymethyldihydropteridine diphosphokinase [bacterium]|nr:2-amino-4-hydroxy-6-hydroxymethyldihydropteridine diphosphokinase [bacterium]
MRMHEVYLSMGSNIGDRELNLRNSLKKLSSHVKLGRVSSLYESVAISDAPQDKYLNIAVKVSTQLNPNELLRLLKEIEVSFGRNLEEKNMPRAMDIDIVFFDLLNVKQLDLEIPHPRSHLRAFVLMPLIEIDPNLIHPSLNKNLKDILIDLEDQDIVKLNAINY